MIYRFLDLNKHKKIIGMRCTDQPLTRSQVIQVLTSDNFKWYKIVAIEDCNDGMADYIAEVIEMQVLDKDPVNSIFNEMNAIADNIEKIAKKRVYNA